MKEQPIINPRINRMTIKLYDSAIKKHIIDLGLTNLRMPYFVLNGALYV